MTLPHGGAYTRGMTQTLATRYQCLSDISMHCTKGNGKPQRDKCKYCGSRLLMFTGLWGVYVWRGDGRYTREQARATYTRYGAADKAATADSTLVVRWIDQTELVEALIAESEDGTLAALFEEL